MNKEDRVAKLVDLMGEYISTEFMEWLIDKGFFTAPASTKYHGSFEGGLLDHCLAVTEALVKLTKQNGLKWKKIRSPYIVGMFHDLCKIDNYIKTKTGYEYNDGAAKGHGEKSIMLLQEFIDLTEEEILCIRWHMGAFDDKENWNSFSGSIHCYPNVLWTHQADMIAAHVMCV